MSITSAGIMCDVCGGYCLLEVLSGSSVCQFKVKGINRMLHADNKCEKLLRDISTDWTKLPDGPLKRAFKEAHENSLATNPENVGEKDE